MLAENKEKTILHLCADIGSDSMPYRKAGYNVICIGKNIGLENYEPPENVYGIISNPPCTMFTFCRTKAKKPRDLNEGLYLVKHCQRIIWTCQTRIINDNQKYSPLKFWVLENPFFGMLKWFLGKPALVYDPWEYGEQYQKRTALWGMFNEPKKIYTKKEDILTKEQIEKHKTNSQSLLKFDMMKTKDIAPDYYGKLTRQDRRSICSEKFAQAFYEANK